MKLSVRPLAASLALGLSFAAHATTITVASFPSFDESVKLAIPLYKKLHPDVEIKVVSLAFNDHHNAMTTALATGSNVPDVMGIEIGYMGKFAESGGLEDLNQAPYNAQQFKAKFLRFAFPQGAGAVAGQVAIPADVGPGTLFYRKDILDKAGVTEAELTKSWDDFIKTSKTIKEKTGAYMLANAGDIFSIYIRSNLKDGEGVFFDKNGASLLNTPRFKRALELARDARKAGIDGKIGTWSSEWSEAFKRNQLASQMMGAWLAGHFETWLAPNTKGLWRASQLPENSFSSWGGSFYAIPKKAEHKKEAWEFVKFMTMNKEMQLLAYKKMGAYPASAEVQNDPFMNEPVEFLGGQKARLLWKTAAGRIPAIDVDKYDNVALEIVGAALDDVLEDDKDVDKALVEADAKLRRRVRR
ncbi:extracellular solute-binding protein [Niveibacterium sp. SC-1]|uniref:ABC transporter substrate-binding protein n=1 Tax=Niveibacterium sp. SC-1 TaxID=3135646 RepID=UPI00311E8D00